jgi:hypothetical protein
VVEGMPACRTVLPALDHGSPLGPLSLVLPCGRSDRFACVRGGT